MSATPCQQVDERIIEAMRPGEWHRTQWIGGVAFGLGAASGPLPEYGTTRHVLRRLEAAGVVGHRDVEEVRAAGFAIPRAEWRLLAGGDC